MNIGLITARGGSKGLPNKNIAHIAGFPLIYWTINAARYARSIDRLFISTDDSEIASIAAAYGTEVINRPKELAQDDSTSDAVIGHALKHLAERRLLINNLCLLQPTSPLRTACDIDNAYSIFLCNKVDSVISVYRPEHPPAKAFKLTKEGYLVGLLSDNAPFSRRQDTPETCLANGAIYWLNKDAFIQHNQIPRTNIRPYFMNEQNSIDIDNLADLKKAERVLTTRYLS